MASIFVCRTNSSWASNLLGDRFVSRLSKRIRQEPPIHRKLHGYAFDPSLSVAIETADINDVLYRIRWEEPLEPGPVGEYIEVVDFDPTVGENDHEHRW